MFTIGVTAISPEVILKDNLDGNSAYISQRVSFICTIRSTGTLILTWTSDEYIGPESVLQFALVDSPGRTANSPTHQTTVATLINTTTDHDTGVTEIVSELRITASMQYPTASVSCRINSHGIPKTIMFSKEKYNLACIIIP